MTNIIKKIRNIIGENNRIALYIWDNEIWFELWETEIPIVIDISTNEVYLDCETNRSRKIDSSMLEELTEIVKLIKNNIEIFTEIKGVTL